MTALIFCFDKSPEEAVQYLKSLGIEITWDWTEQLNAIKKQAFTIAKVSSADLLQNFKDQLQKALDSGYTYEDFKKDMTAILESTGYEKREDGTAWRLETIYRTNLQSSYMAGRYNQMMDVSEESPYWEFISVSDFRTTSGCRELNGTILRYDDPFWKTNYPPRHYNCRSRVRALSISEMKAKGLSLTNPSDVEGTRPANGFETSPGDWKPDMTKYDNDILSQLSKMVR